MSIQAKNDPGRGKPYEPCSGIESVCKNFKNLYEYMYAYIQVYLCERGYMCARHMCGSQSVTVWLVLKHLPLFV